MNELQVGDYIYAYHAGIHRVIDMKIKDVGSKTRSVIAGIVTYEKVLDSNGKPSAKRKKSCNISFCTKITPDLVQQQYTDEIAEATSKREAILKLLDD